MFVSTLQSPKDKISYVPLNPVADYVYISYLNTILRVGWKRLPNLNFKLKFQTQTWISETKIFPILPGNPGFWEIYPMGKRNKIKKSMSFSLGEAMIWSRGGTQGFLNHSKRPYEPCKGKSIYSDLGILYPTTEIKNQNLNFKLRWHKIFCWHLGINSFWSQLVPAGKFHTNGVWNWNLGFKFRARSTVFQDLNKWIAVRE